MIGLGIWRKWKQQTENVGSVNRKQPIPVKKPNIEQSNARLSGG